MLVEQFGQRLLALGGHADRGVVLEHALTHEVPEERPQAAQLGVDASLGVLLAREMGDILANDGVVYRGEVVGARLPTGRGEEVAELVETMGIGLRCKR